MVQLGSNRRLRFSGGLGFRVDGSGSPGCTPTFGEAILIWMIVEAILRHRAWAYKVAWGRLHFRRSRLWGCCST